MKKILWLLVLVLEQSEGRRFWEEFEWWKGGGRSLLQQQFEDNCTMGSDLVLEQYPSVVSLRDPQDREAPGQYALCGGVLLTTDTILTSTGCIWQNVESGIPFNLVVENPVNRTFESDFLVAIAPYCSNGDGAEVLQLLGYHFMEDTYTGFPKDGNAVTVLELNSSVTSLINEQIPALRTDPMPVNTVLTLVGHGGVTDQEASLQNRNFSRPAKVINYQTITDAQCEQLLVTLRADKQLDQTTETCAVVTEVTDDNVCNGDDGSPLFDDAGNIAGVITWWSVNQCERQRDETMPIVFADVTKQTVKDFIVQTETESLYRLPTISDGCEDGQPLENAPWAVSLQFQRFNDPTQFHHLCSGALIDEGTKIIAAAGCIWDTQLPLPNSALQSSGGVTTTVFDMRNPESDSPYEGDILIDVFVALAPRCRHYNGIEPRTRLSNYTIKPEYTGDPRDGNNVAIFGLVDQFPPEASFPLFEESLKSINNPPIEDFSDVTFYSWGAETRDEALEDELGFFYNWKAAKEVSMILVDEEDCARSLLLEDPGNAFDRVTELCADQTAENFTNICTYDIGGPLVAEYTPTNQLVLIGLKSQLQDRQCFDGPGFYEVFTDLFEVKDFILSVLDPQDPPPPPQPFFPPLTTQVPSDEVDNNTTLIIVLTVVCSALVLILVIAFFAYRYVSYNNKVAGERMRLLQGSTGLSTDIFQLNKEIQNIHFMLANIARKCRNPHTGKARRHSDLAASLEFLLSQEKVQNQIVGYTMFAPDDSVLNATRGAAPLSPFLLAVMNKNQGVAASENNQMAIQRTLGVGQHEQIQKRIQMSMAMNFGGEEGRLKGGSGLILPDTPARDDFDMTIDFDKELEIGERLGTGAFGSVYRAFWITRNMDVAVKIVHAHILEQLIDDQEQGGSFLNSIIGELSLLGRIDSPNVVRCYGGCLKPPNVCLVLEFLSKGSLDRVIHAYPGDIPIGFVMRVAQGIAEGLDTLHPTIVHRDLKPQNVLLSDSYQVKLADFGMSKMKEDTYLSETMVKGTPAYIAPEAFKGESVDEKCDIYALGLIMWEMVAKQRPWQDLNLPVVIMARVAIKGERPPIPDTCPNELKRLIERCWAPNPKERPSAREVAQRLTILRRGSKKDAMSDHTAFTDHISGLSAAPAQTGQSTQNLISQSINYSQFSIQSSVSQIQ